MDIREQVYSLLNALNTNTSPSYPDDLFYGGSHTFPLTVYDVETSTQATIKSAEFRVRVTVTVDIFAPTRGELTALAVNTRSTLIAAGFDCNTDKESGGKPLARRSQRYSGLLDLLTNTIYKE